jgi:hypothetical protein
VGEEKRERVDSKEDARKMVCVVLVSAKEEKGNEKDCRQLTI